MRYVLKGSHHLIALTTDSLPYVKQSLASQFVETRVEKAEDGQSLQEPLVVDEGQHASDHWGRCLEGRGGEKRTLDYAKPPFKVVTCHSEFL